MNLYRVRGADQKEYGPIDTDQLRQWIAERRLNQFSQACLDADGIWRPLGQFPEFADALGLSAGGVPGAGATVSPVTEGLPINAPLTPPPGGNWMADGREAARRRLATPALFLIVIAVLGLVGALTTPLWRGAYIESFQNLPNIPPEVKEQLRAARDKGMGVSDFVQLGLSLVTNGLMLAGALKMRKLESFGLSATAAILSILPCTCYCLGLPFGIWALVVMNKPEVKEHFT